MSVSYAIGSRLRRLLQTLTALHTSAGSFSYRGLRVWHLGLRLDQIAVAELLDEAVAELAKQGHRPEVVEPLLARTTVWVTPDRPVLNGMQIEEFCRWTGGLRDRGEIRLAFDAAWLERLGALLRALLLHELVPGQVGRPGRVF